MNAITHVFFDIGGVLASNGWDREQRKKAVEQFGLDAEDFQARHEEMVGPLEEGQISLDEYLHVTLFCVPRSFSKEEFREFMLAQSVPNPETIAIARSVAVECVHWTMTLNNESDELNRHRLDTFGLDGIFDAFLSSCWLGLRKPTRKFFDRALQIAQARPERSVFIDDRAQNIVPARELGMHTIHYQSPELLRSELGALGVTLNGNQ